MRALALLGAGFAVTLLVEPWSDARVTDLPLYSAYAESFLAGQLPYRDVPFEYPPLAAPLLAVPGAAGPERYGEVFGALALLLAGALVLLTGALARSTGGDRRRALLLAACLPLLCGAVVRTRFDLAPVVLTLAALLLLCRGRPRGGMAVLGAGVAMKLFPLVVAPVALGWLLARGQRRAAAEGAAAMAIVLVAAFGGAAALSAGGLADSVSYHLERPAQVESTPAAVLLGLDAAGAGDARSVHSHGSDGIVHPADDLVTGALAALMVGVLVLLTLAVAPGGTGDTPAGARELVLASLTAVAAFAALGKVLSPQFLIWIVPLGALALAWRMHALAAGVAAAALLTLLEFPAHYDAVVAREPLALLLVGARDATLLACVVLAVREVSPLRERASGSARSPLLARRHRPRPAPR